VKDHEIGWTPLHFAAENDQSQEIKLLLNNKADVNARDTKIGWTPLHFAVMKGHEAVIELLIEKGAHVNVHDAEGWTPLRFARFAANREHEAVVGSLIHNGAEDEVMSNEISWTALHLEAVDSQQELTKLLVKNRLDIDTRSISGSRLHLAEMIAAKQLTDANINAQDKDGTTPLHRAARSGKERLVRLLISKGASVDKSDISDMSPLMMAAQNGHEEVAKGLTEGGANLDTTNKSGSALHFAVEHGHEVVVKLLVEGGAEVDMRINGETPLRLVFASNNEASEGVIRTLMDNGADISNSDYAFQTPPSAFQMRLESGSKWADNGFQWVVP
jgi:ankyrin repeat protein